MIETGAVLTAIERLVKPGMVAFDVGANRGLTAQALSERGAVVYAFEPVPACIEQIRARNLAGVTIVESALSDEVGTATFHIDAREGLGMEASSLRELDDVPGEAITVPVTTLDQFAGEHGLIPDFVKIDVEGVEERVIAGAMRTIREHRPIIIFEVWGYNWMRFAEVIAWLKTLYSFECASDGSDALECYSAGVVAENDDVICLPL